MKVQISGVMRHSSVNGPGIRYVCFFQGCPHHCPGCQNPETWNPTGGDAMDTEDLISDLRGTRYLDGLTLSGGDPLYQPQAALELAKAAHYMGIDVWCYTGWTYEELLQKIASDEADANVAGSTSRDGDASVDSDCDANVAVPTSRDGGVPVGSDANVAGPTLLQLLREIDVLVDGRFVSELRSEDVLYRGSSNQRLIDMKKSLQTGQAVSFDSSL